MSKQITEYQTKEKEKNIVVPAALTYDKGAPKIETKPIPLAAPKPTEQKPEAKPIPKETQIILKGLQQIENSFADIEGVIFGMRQQIMQLYTTVDYKHISYAFQPELAAMLNFEQKENYWIIKPKSFLGGDLFGDIAEIVRGLGGEYISAGKDSHFRVKIN
jgi:hypothetical protein